MEVSSHWRRESTVSGERVLRFHLNLIVMDSVEWLPNLWIVLHYALDIYASSNRSHVVNGIMFFIKLLQLSSHYERRVQMIVKGRLLVTVWIHGVDEKWWNEACVEQYPLFQCGVAKQKVVSTPFSGNCLWWLTGSMLICITNLWSNKNV